MPPLRTTVFLPCHTLDEFPTWLEEAEADDLLAAWTAAWHPCLIASAGEPPQWASIDLPIAGGPLLGLVPSTWDDRFAAQFDATAAAGSSFVRRIAGLEAMTAAAAAACGATVEDPFPGDRHADDFRALGLAALLAQLLARRMRSVTDLESTGFSAAVVAAARAAVDGDDAAVRSGLRECFDSLAATRAHYYPVDSWVVDLVLVAATTSRESLAADLDALAPISIAATGAAIEDLASVRPEALAELRKAVAEGRVGLCGGRDRDLPLDACTPEQLQDSFLRGRAAWREHLGAAPTAFARVTGGGSALLPQLLAGFGCTAGIWSLFDGGGLPDVGRGMIRWEAAGSGVEMLAAQPLDARLARTVLALPEALGEAMDREHVAALLFARYAGTASRWHELLRRIGRWSTLLGTFVTVDELVRHASGSGTLVDLEPDSFPPTLSAPFALAGEEPVEAAIAAARVEARRIVAAAGSLTAGAVTAGSRPAAANQSSDRPAKAQPVPLRRWLPRGLFAAANESGRLVLDNGLLRLEAHPRTGGLLSLRRPADRGNRLSQQLAIRTTRPVPEVGGGWTSPEERAVYAAMVADTVTHEMVAGRDSLVARGRLVDADGGTAARFTQRFMVVESLPLAMIDIEVRLERTLAGPLLESHVASRCAWHENEQVEIRRSLHTQSVATERSRFTAPHFIEIVPGGGRHQPGDAVVILTGGLPWHLLSSPHVLDSVLAGGAATSLTRRLAVGIGLEAPWDAALALLADAPLAPRRPGVPANVRVTVLDTTVAAGRLVGARVGLLESAGRAGEVRIDWGRTPTRAGAIDLDGHPRQDADVAIEGSCTVVSLDRYQWLQLDLGFAG
ncbi:MAG: hypothetical protein RLZZ111_251 [Planctomycetota bacterium]